ncbi:MAG: peptidylprolyl isomerase [Planctomycetota bacterium]|nr:peptidylprolyl isomerase [Planctomycetota bacterium]MDA1112790.1 peptidylprolyl isomerase [Planctomycetota bacterium]
MISILALAALPLFQAPEKPERLKPLVPAPENYQPPKLGTQTVKPKPVDQEDPFSGAFRELSSENGSPLAVEGPRDLRDGRALPFSNDRPLLNIDGVEIYARELNELVEYYRSFQSGSDDMMLQAAVKALLPVKVMEARFQAQLPTLFRNIEEAHEAAVAGEDFASVVARFSGDTEAPTDDARYTFGREVAVQPFDRISHTSAVNAFSAPFLTVYGYHFLQVVSYERGDKPKDDQTTVRHVLIMFPEMVNIEKEGGDVRVWIKQQVKAAKIQVLEAGMQNLVPPENRGQIISQ